MRQTIELGLSWDEIMKDTISGMIESECFETLSLLLLFMMVQIVHYFVAEGDGGFHFFNNRGV